MKKLLIILLILIVACLAARNLIARAVIDAGIKTITGLDSQINNVSLGLTKGYFGISGLRIINPEGFTDKILADLPQIYAEYKLGDFFKGKVHLKELNIELAELDVIRSKDNRVNVSALKVFLPKPGAKQLALQIDNLNLKLGKVIYKDYVTGNPEIRKFNINDAENFQNINDPKALVSLILFKTLSGTSVPGLANIDLGTLKENIRGIAAGQIESTVQQFKGKVQEKLKSILPQ